MTRDGVVLENQTTGEEINISDREAEQGFTPAEATGRAKTRVRRETRDKPPPAMKPNPASRPVQEVLLFTHGKIHEVEHENVGVEGGCKGEELAERQAGRAVRGAIRRHRLKPYRELSKAERLAEKANIVTRACLRRNERSEAK